jgi:hypothetical protein
MQEAINEYITDKKIVSPADLINDLLPRFYPVSDLVLDAAKYFTTIIKSKDFCVESNILVKYGILSEHKNGHPKSANVLRLLQQYNRVENVDYHRLNVEPMVNRRQGGGKQSEEYIMTPKTFFLCLTRSKNSCEYAEYYFHVLELYDYYEEYYTKMYKETIVEKDDSISKLRLDIQTMMSDMSIERQRRELQHKELMANNEESKQQLKQLDICGINNGCTYDPRTNGSPPLSSIIASAPRI